MLLQTHAPELACGASAIAAFKIAAPVLLAQVRENRQGVIDGRDAEYLHRMRVVVRRLRSLCGAYEKVLPQAVLQAFYHDLKWLAHALGPARDADVFVIDIWPPLRAALDENRLLTQLDVVWAARRQAARARARRALSSRRYQRFMQGSVQWPAGDAWREQASARRLAVLDGTARRFARRVLDRRDKKVRSNGHAHALTRLDGNQLHALRIRVKKLRYTAECFGALFDSGLLHALMKRLSRLQEVLGAINDVEVAVRQVTAALLHRRGRAVIDLRTALNSWRTARMAVLHRKLRAAWREYRHAEVFW